MYSLNLTLALILTASVMIQCCPEPPKPQISTNTGIKCECAGFKNNVLTDEDKPLVVHNPMNMTCDEEGTKQCLELCTGLVAMGKDKASETLCAQLNHADNLKPSVFAKVCDKPWSFTGITAEAAICCDDGQSVKCLDEVL